MLTVREAAEKLGAAASSVRLWVRTGRFPGAKLEETPVGSYWLIPETDLEGFSIGKAGRPPKVKGVTKGKRKKR